MKKYSIIYADPPWHYKTYSPKGNGRSAEKHFPTMSIEQIKALPVEKLAADDCALFMWITFPCMKEAFQVLEAWGFQYKTVAFVWAKQNRVSDGLFWGMGYWTRSNAEICVLATKGHPKRVSSGVHQVIMSHVQRHSQKPDEARERIVQLMGDLPRIELFARQKTDGWDVWGNEVDSSIELSEKRNEGGNMSNQELNTLLYRKLETEQKNYKRWLLAQPPEVILANAYKYAMREDVLLCFEDNDLPDNLARALLRSSEPLEKIFAAWEARGSGHMDSMWEKAQEYAAQLAQKAARTQHQKAR